MKKFTRFLGILAVIVGLGFSLSSCNMDITGYKVEYYVITPSIYNNRPSDVTPEEALDYVKNLTSGKHTYWCGSENELREFFTEKIGYISNLDEVIDDINNNSTSVRWYKPGLLSTVDDYYFFYVKNNEF
ncbi:MAG: hypothetical protein J6J67_07545 [Treponema sp.]|nr:hypothetical protein [Treponema sp.]